MAAPTAPPPPSGGGSGSGDGSLADLQKIAGQFGIDPYSLNDEELKQFKLLAALASATGIDPQTLLMSQQLQEAGLVTPSFLQKLLFGAEGAGGDMRSREFDDPRYWDLQYKQLYQNALNMGLDSESARRQALATLITNRNNTQLGIAQTSADVAAQAAKFAAEPSDAVAELLFRNSVGGSTPFGSVSSNPEAYAKYGDSLDKKFMELFGGVAKDLQTARDSAGQWPQPDFVNPAPAIKPILGYAKGGQIDFDGMMKGRAMAGYSPPSSEGGTNMNIHERAVIVGESGHVYATLGEKRPDGSQRAEQLIIKPLKSEVEKDKKLADAGKAITETQNMTMKSFAGGGSVTGIPSPDDFLAELSKALGRLGGAGGGVGEFASPLPDARMLAGAPWQALQEDPNLLGLTQAGYKTKQGGTLNPLELSALVRKFTPNAPQNNIPRLSFA